MGIWIRRGKLVMRNVLNNLLFLFKLDHTPSSKSGIELNFENKEDPSQIRICIFPSHKGNPIY